VPQRLASGAEEEARLVRASFFVSGRTRAIIDMELCGVMESRPTTSRKRSITYRSTASCSREKRKKETTHKNGFYRKARTSDSASERDWAPKKQFAQLMETSSGTCRVSGVELHVVEAGPVDGPVVILLHGFPDFWWGWRHQIEPLAALGFHIVVPDGRGYNLSDKPQGVGSYGLDTLAADVVALADFYKADTFRLVGHDWGGIVAWQVAKRYPERVKRLVILNAPHPDVFPRFVRKHLSQAFKSLYSAFFQLPWLPEAALKAGRFALLRRALARSSRSGTFTPDDLENYAEAWQQPGALTAMLNYYRALRRQPLGPLSRVHPPTLVIWGKRDVFLETGLATASLKLCNDVQNLFVDNAGHWVQLEEADMVNSALARFFASR
jgi:pimeloyl-ACP methyl ester carboxylesterase